MNSRAFFLPFLPRFRFPDSLHLISQFCSLVNPSNSSRPRFATEHIRQECVHRVTYAYYYMTQLPVVFITPTGLSWIILGIGKIGQRLSRAGWGRKRRRRERRKVGSPAVPSRRSSQPPTFSTVILTFAGRVLRPGCCYCCCSLPGACGDRCSPAGWPPGRTPGI